MKSTRHEVDLIPSIVRVGFEKGRWMGGIYYSRGAGRK